MGKQEPWFKPRADEDADEQLVNWLGGWKNPPPQPAKTGGGCLRVAAPAAGVVVAMLLVAAR